jgi:mannose-6-phosphate isomerase-like protein (cupin superfamily)
MPVIANARVKKFTLPGIVHQTLAGPEHGLKSLEIWRHTLAPGAASPVHRHNCEEVVLILKGSGRVTIAGQDLDFGPDTTLIVPPGVDHQLVNTGTEEMALMAVLGAAPSETATPEGELIPLPWQAR